MCLAVKLRADGEQRICSDLKTLTPYMAAQAVLLTGNVNIDIRSAVRCSYRYRSSENSKNHQSCGGRTLKKCLMRGIARFQSAVGWIETSILAPFSSQAPNSLASCYWVLSTSLAGALIGASVFLRAAFFSSTLNCKHCVEGKRFLCASACFGAVGDARECSVKHRHQGFATNIAYTERFADGPGPGYYANSSVHSLT